MKKKNRKKDKECQSTMQRHFSSASEHAHWKGVFLDSHPLQDLADTNGRDKSVKINAKGRR